VFTARYALSPYIKQIRFVFKGLRTYYREIQEDVTEGWISVHKEELRNLYCSPNIISMIKSEVIRWAGYRERMGQKRSAYRVLVEKP
jgi:hypothetical protein